MTIEKQKPAVGTGYGRPTNWLRRKWSPGLLVALIHTTAIAQTAFTWQQIKTQFQAVNPTLKAARLEIDESRANEITAYLRPNPDFTFTADGVQISRNQGVWQPFSGV